MNKPDEREPLLSSVMASLRPPFLVLGPICVLLGAAVATWTDSADNTTNWWSLLLALVCALCLHAAVNALNEYHDFHSGLDFDTQKTPFSGGSGALPANPAAAPAVLLTAKLLLGMAVFIGLFFVMRHGWPVILTGLAGVAILLAYTPWINRFALICLIAPGLAFGVLMVSGSARVVGGAHDSSVWLASLVPFFLINNLLLMNQLPDRAADEAAGRNHLVIRHGQSTALLVYALFWLGAALTISVASATGHFPRSAWLALTGLLPAAAAWVIAIRQTRQGADNINALIPALGLNVITALVAPALLTIAFLTG